MQGEELILRPVEEVCDRTLQSFDCGVIELNTFLSAESKLYAQHGITFTTVVFRSSDPDLIVGYFSLSADAIRLNLTEQGDLGLPFHAPILFYPAVKITKLAVNSAFQSQGIGAKLIDLIEGLAFDGPTAVRLLNVNAVNNPRTIKFYERCRFMASLDAEQRKKNQPRNKRRDPEDETVLMHRDIYADPQHIC